MPVMISDASVLISLGAVRQIHLLPTFYVEVVVPEAVWREVTVGAVGRAGAKDAIQANQQAQLPPHSLVRVKLKPNPSSA